MQLNGKPQVFRKTSEVEVLGKSDTGYIVRNAAGNPDDQWEVPSDVFKATYQLVDGPVNPDLENRFSYHSPKPTQIERYAQIRQKAKELAYLLEDQCPNSREKSLALTNLEQTVFWANAAIARN